MCANICICMYIYIYIYEHKQKYIVCACRCAGMPSLCVCIHVHTCVCIHLYVYKTRTPCVQPSSNANPGLPYVFLHTLMRVHKYTYKNVCVYEYIHAYVFLCACTQTVNTKWHGTYIHTYRCTHTSYERNRGKHTYICTHTSFCLAITHTCSCIYVCMCMQTRTDILDKGCRCIESYLCILFCFLSTSAIISYFTQTVEKFLPHPF
jgi:hypothetical protein